MYNYVSVHHHSPVAATHGCFFCDVSCAISPSADVTLRFICLCSSDWANHDVKYNGAYNRCERPFTHVGTGTVLQAVVVVVAVHSYTRLPAR